MDKPENGILIIPRVDKLEDGSFAVLIRRCTFVNYLIVAKDLLLPNGEWLGIPEGGEFPKECFLKSHMIDRGSFDRLEFNWPPRIEL